MSEAGITETGAGPGKGWCRFPPDRIMSRFARITNLPDGGNRVDRASALTEGAGFLESAANRDHPADLACILLSLCFRGALRLKNHGTGFYEDKEHDNR